MLEDAQAPVLLTQEQLLDSVPAAYWGTVLMLDQEQESLAAEPAENPASEWLGGEQLCYVAYTSGSTGQPKGVAGAQGGGARPPQGANYWEGSPPRGKFEPYTRGFFSGRGWVGGGVVGWGGGGGGEGGAA